jgi:ATP-dependent Clp protease ATP-binding subunit ClpC
METPDTAVLPAAPRPAPGVLRLLQAARDRQERAGHPLLGLNHLLRALLEGVPLMAAKLVPELDTDAVLRQTKQSLEAGDIGIPVTTDDALERAAERARARGKSTIYETDYVAVVLASAGYPVLLEGGGAVPSLRGANPATPNGENSIAPPAKRFPALERYGHDLTEAARQGKLPPFVGREGEVQMVIETLCRRITRNPVLVGPAGVGKTAIVEGLAQRIASGDVPNPLKGARLFALMPSALTAGASHYGELEKRMESVLQEAREPGVMLFIDEVHAIVGAGGRPGSNDLATLLKPALSRGEVACLAATTDDEYRRFIEADPALERRFQPIRIHELSPMATLEILQRLRSDIAGARGVRVSDDALRYLIDVAARYLRNRHFPAKAVDLFEQCVAYAVAQGRHEVATSDADVVVRRQIGMPILPEERLKDLTDRLTTSAAATAVFTESDVEILTGRLQVSLEGFDLRPERPNAAILLTGRAAPHAPALAHEIAEGLFNDARRVITIDFARFTEAHHINMLLGSPPGYIGYSERLPLHSLAQMPWCVLLCQNVDQCHPTFRTTLARALETGTFTDAAGKDLYISDAVLLLTAPGVTLDDEGMPVGARRIGLRAGAFGGRGQEDISAAVALRHAAELALGPDLADHCDLVCSGVNAEADADTSAARRRVEQGILSPLARRYAREGLTLAWDTTALDWLAAHEPSQTSPRDQERLADLYIIPLLKPFRNPTAAPDETRAVLLRCDDAGALMVTADSDPEPMLAEAVGASAEAREGNGTRSGTARRKTAAAG